MDRVEHRVEGCDRVPHRPDCAELLLVDPPEYEPWTVDSMPHDAEEAFIAAGFSLQEMQRRSQSQRERLTYEPPYPLRRIAEREPEIAWLCWLPPSERAFYEPHRDRVASAAGKEIEEWVWRKLYAGTATTSGTGGTRPTS